MNTKLTATERTYIVKGINAEIEKVNNEIEALNEKKSELIIQLDTYRDVEDEPSDNTSSQLKSTNGIAKPKKAIVQKDLPHYYIGDDVAYDKTWSDSNKIKFALSRMGYPYAGKQADIKAMMINNEPGLAKNDGLKNVGTIISQNKGKYWSFQEAERRGDGTYTLL